MVGVQIAGALKNVIAFLCGVSDGLGNGCNQKAVLITKGIQEIGKLVATFGGSVETIYGIAGLGDTIVTSLSPLSRNWQAGKLLAEGHRKQEIVEHLMKMVVESFYVVDALPFLLGENAEVEYPLLSQVLEIGGENA
jgi:glycerol-3-phosphate dehydrogenase (NAD(P)+)